MRNANKLRSVPTRQCKFFCFFYVLGILLLLGIMDSLIDTEMEHLDNALLILRRAV